MSDTDAAAYIAAVETADGQSLPGYVSAAIDAFVVGAKSDGFWAAIKAACFLAGPRTLAGALTPLAGAAPTSFNFVADDYNRATGLKGNAVDKRLNANRNNNADPQNSKHLSVWLSEPQSGGTTNNSYLGCSLGDGRSILGVSGNRTGWIASANSRTSALSGADAPRAELLLGTSRVSPESFTVRHGGSSITSSIASEPPLDASLFAFSRTATDWHSDARIAWYSVGESLSLANLDTRLTTYMAAIAAGPSGSPRRRRMMMMQRGSL